MPSSSSPIVLVSSADEHYRLPLAVTIYSALAHLDSSYPVHVGVLDGGLSPDTKERFERMIASAPSDATLSWLTPDLANVSDLKQRDWISPTTYLRWFIADLLPTHDRAIYLDSDVLVQRSLHHLWEMPLNDHPIGAVQAYGTPYVGSKRGLPFHKEIGLSADTPYLNTGVMLMDLASWRERDLTQRAMRLRLTYEDPTMDQGALNAALGGDWEPLDLRWNVMSHLLNFDRWPDSPFKERVRPLRRQLLDEAYVFHFAGGGKPWQIGCDHPAQLRWIHTLAASGFFSQTERASWLGAWFLRYGWWRLKRRLDLPALRSH